MSSTDRPISEDVCPKCGGGGGGHDAMQTCDECHGTGEVLPEDEPDRWPCQNLLGGSGAAIYLADPDGMCKHPECKPPPEDVKRTCCSMSTPA